jgi:septal ring factor EnvC (AmiA/AmiB activator)
MPRGKKKMTLEEQLEQVKADIETTKAKLSELEQKEKDLNKMIEEEELRNLRGIIKEYGLSFEDIRTLITKENS